MASFAASAARPTLLHLLRLDWRLSLSIPYALLRTEQQSFDVSKRYYWGLGVDFVVSTVLVLLYTQQKIPSV